MVWKAARADRILDTDTKNFTQLLFTTFVHTTPTGNLSYHKTQKLHAPSLVH